MMAALELDPLFVKALKLLHSKSKDSADQLKQMIDDVLAQRRGETIKKESKDGDRSATSSSGKQTPKEDDKKREAEKRSFEKLKQDLSDLSSQSKKPRLDTDKDNKEDKAAKVREKEKSREREKEREREREREKEREKREKEKELKEREKREAEKRERDKKAKEEPTEISSDSDDSKSLDADDFAFDLGIACVVCRSFDVSSGNQLVECQECHSLYHQECHRPPVTEQDVNDPRFVWYCTRCAKTLKKMVAKPSKPKPVFSSGVKDNGNNGKSVKSEPTTLFPFRRTEPIKPSSSRDTASSAAKPLSGLASLAANLSGKASSEAVKSKSDMIKLGAPKTDTSKASGIKLSEHRFAAQLSKADHVDRSVSSSTHGQKSSSKPSSSSSSHKSSSSGGAVSVMNADKRLQMMKKKAAAAKQLKSMK